MVVTKLIVLALALGVIWLLYKSWRSYPENEDKPVWRFFMGPTEPWWPNRNRAGTSEQRSDVRVGTRSLVTYSFFESTAPIYGI